MLILWATTIESKISKFSRKKRILNPRVWSIKWGSLKNKKNEVTILTLSSISIPSTFSVSFLFAKSDIWSSVASSSLAYILFPSNWPWNFHKRDAKLKMRYLLTSPFEQPIEQSLIDTVVHGLGTEIDHLKRWIWIRTNVHLQGFQNSTRIR